MTPFDSAQPTYSSLSGVKPAFIRQNAGLYKVAIIGAIALIIIMFLQSMR